MALEHSPSIVRQGLQFLFDMASPSSFKGAPTTNITPALGLIGVQSVTPTYVGNEGSWRKYSLTGTWTAGTYPYSLAVSTTPLTGGVSYSTGCYIKTNVPHKFVDLFTGMNYVNQPMNNVGVSFSVPQKDGSVYVGRTNFQYTSTVSETGYLISQPVIGTVFNPATDFVYIKDGQIEQSTFNTPYVNGTRSNTQAIIDPVGANTIKVNGSLTYGSNYVSTGSAGTTTNYLTISPAALNGLSTWTIDFWMQRDATNAIDTFLSTGGLNEFLWYFTGETLTYVNQSTNNANISYPITNGIPFNFVATGENNQVRFYKNGSLLTTASVLTNIAVGSPLGIVVGQELDNNAADGGMDSAQSFLGKFYSCKFYNRKLSDAEILQNFNSLKGRYGL